MRVPVRGLPERLRRRRRGGGGRAWGPQLGPSGRITSSADAQRQRLEVLMHRTEKPRYSLVRRRFRDTQTILRGHSAWSLSSQYKALRVRSEVTRFITEGLTSCVREAGPPGFESVVRNNRVLSRLRQLRQSNDGSKTAFAGYDANKQIQPISFKQWLGVSSARHWLMTTWLRQLR